MGSPPPSPKRLSASIRLPPSKRFCSRLLPTASPIPVNPLPLPTNPDGDFCKSESPLTPIVTQSCSIYTYTCESETYVPETDLGSSVVPESEREEAELESTRLKLGGDVVAALKPEQLAARGFVTPPLTDRLYWQNPKRAMLVDFMCILCPGYWDLIFGQFGGCWVYLWSSKKEGEKRRDNFWSSKIGISIFLIKSVTVG